jgi:peptide/nickel transport system permease protein
MIDSKQNIALQADKKPGISPPPTADPKARSQFADFWLRFRKHQMAVFGSALFAFLLFVAVVGPFLVAEPKVDVKQMSQLKNQPPSFDHFFGTNNIGLDVMAMVVHGARISLFLSLMAMLVTCFIGTVIGLVSAYFGGWIDIVLMRIVDIFLSVPLLIVLLMASRFLVTPPPPGGSGGKIIEGAEIRSLTLLPLILGLLSWPRVARLVRSVTLSIKEQDFVTGARAIGAKNNRIMFIHILPNVINPVVVAGTLLIGQFIVLESFLSFLGYGIQPPLRSWGTSLADAQSEFSAGNWWWAFFPGHFILLTVLAINFIGDGLRDALDPRSKQR